MKEKNRTNRNLKGQGSTEYILMLAGAIIVAIVILVFVFKVGGTAAKSGGLQAELLGAEQYGTSANTIAIAVNEQLPGITSSGVVANVVAATGNSIPSGTITGVYNVSGGYEYLIAGTGTGMPTSISSITYSTSSGQVLILPESGTPVSVVADGSYPFTISQIT
ncbi:MAG: hypothetical protein QW478_15515 [Candidatus Micrarchaeaceae archaeon]